MCSERTVFASAGARSPHMSMAQLTSTIGRRCGCRSCPDDGPACRARAEGEKMISWRFAVPAILVAAAAAGGITYFATPGPPQLIEAGQRSQTTVPKATDRPDSAVSRNVQPSSREDDITAYQRAADAILKRAQNAKASADELTERIPLPKRRPLPRP